MYTYVFACNLWSRKFTQNVTRKGDKNNGDEQKLKISKKKHMNIMINITVVRAVRSRSKIMFYDNFWKRTFV